MIPKINNRGHSFKGVIAYLIHDKDRAETSERLAWSHTENLHTNDPEKAAKLMAWTAMNAEKLKKESGGSAVGRKPSAGEVWHSSLAWALGEDPSIEHQRDTARDYIQKHGLSEHEYMIIGHNDTDHVHAHVVVNLVHPETGKTHDVGLDKRRAQEWALQYEQEHGLHCQARLDNAEKREQGEITKHQDQKQDYSDKITRAYYAADSGKAFVHALKEEGLQLGKARRGDHNYVIVDDKGDIQKLSRQLEIEEKGKYKTAAIKALLFDIDRESVRDAEGLAHEIKSREIESPAPVPEKEDRTEDIQAEPTPSEYFDRDNYYAQQQEATEKAAIEAEKQRITAEKAADKARVFKEQDSRKEKQQAHRQDAERVRAQGSFADELDKTREQEAQAEAEAARIEEIFGQQERNIEEGIKRGVIEAPEPEAETPGSFAELAAQIEKETKPEEPTQPTPEIEKEQSFAELAAKFEKEAEPEQTPSPEPDYQRSFEETAKDYEQPAPEPPEPALAPVQEQQQSFADMAQQYEQAAQNDNSQTPEQTTPQQEQAPAQNQNTGGYER